MDRENFSAALSRWKEILGGEDVLTDAASLERYTSNVSGLKRAVPAVLRPASTEEVRKAVVVANEFKIPLHPVSCGRNWGLGSRLPVRDGTVVVDLAQMNRIREVNVQQHYAVVEPGVTQGALFEHLRQGGLPLVLNVTGASPDTSLIGNALERGVGYFASRAESLAGLEVVLGNGNVIRTGFAHFDGARTAQVYKYGVGPGLDQLFFQSNFGIVTAAGVDLMPRRDAHMAVICKIGNPARLPAFISALADLRRRDVIQTVAHVGNRNRTEIAMAPLVYRQLLLRGGGTEEELRLLAVRLLEQEGFGAWSAVAGVMGTPGQLREVRRQVRKALRGLARVMFLTDGLVHAAKALSSLLAFMPYVQRKRAILEAVEPLYGLAKGVPTDAPMMSVWWPLGDMPHRANEDPDQSRCGLLFCCPFIPADGEAAREVVERTELVYRKYGFTPYITLNMADSRSMECVINLAFDRSQPGQVASAHACNDELTAQLVSLGFVPYRVGIQNMNLVVKEDDPFWQTVRDLKKVLDPNHIISPGRYNLV
ncbi:MAG: FAD-binding protein [Verrucomicrobiota bacterium]